ncbi:Glycosyl transferase family 13 [Trinorchestia longiramus]|nr:Glycosyl transferase family 13 [Trinorchestia longiramus]
MPPVDRDTHMQHRNAQRKDPVKMSGGAASSSQALTIMELHSGLMDIRQHGLLLSVVDASLLLIEFPLFLTPIPQERRLGIQVLEQSSRDDATNSVKYSSTTERSSKSNDFDGVIRSIGLRSTPPAAQSETPPEQRDDPLTRLGGVRVVVLHESAPHLVLTTAHFPTHSAAADGSLTHFISSVQPGRVVVLLGILRLPPINDDVCHYCTQPDSTTWLRAAAAARLRTWLGCECTFHAITRGETWAVVAYKRTRAQQTRTGDSDFPQLMYEGYTTTRIYNKSGPLSSPHHFSVYLSDDSTAAEVRHCDLYSAQWQRQRCEFCEEYEGYGAFCDMSLTAHPSSARELETAIPAASSIPVVMVGSGLRLPTMVLQTTTIRRNKYGSITPLLWCIDICSQQVKRLAAVVSVDLQCGDNRSYSSLKTRINEHVKKCISSAVALWSQRDKFIVLEDDLVLAPDFIRCVYCMMLAPDFIRCVYCMMLAPDFIRCVYCMMLAPDFIRCVYCMMLAPDFISYFQQCAILMDYDEKVMFVNAYRYHAFPHTALDPSVVLRAQSYPYYGWMVRRTDALYLLQNWIPEQMEAGDWDLYMRTWHVGRRCTILPEVPRTKHIPTASAGAHVTADIQERTYNRRPLNRIPEVKLRLGRMWELAYNIDLMLAVHAAHVVNITQHPCSVAPVPEQQNSSYVIYITADGDVDETKSYFVIAKVRPQYE